LAGPEGSPCAGDTARLRMPIGPPTMTHGAARAEPRSNGPSEARAASGGTFPPAGGDGPNAAWNFCADISSRTGNKIGPHPTMGIPEMPFCRPNYFKDECAVAGRQCCSVRRLSPNKRHSNTHSRVPESSREFPRSSTSCWQTASKSVRHRARLIVGAWNGWQCLGVQKNVGGVFPLQPLVDMEELMRFIGAADIYLLAVSDGIADHLGPGWLMRSATATPWCHAILARWNGWRLIGGKAVPSAMRSHSRPWWFAARRPVAPLDAQARHKRGVT